jgi:hypothetical protein
VNNNNPDAARAKGTKTIAAAGAGSTQPPKARSGLFLGKAPQIVNVDAALDEMNNIWKAKLMDLHS